VGIGISALTFDFFFLTPRYHFSLAPTAYPRFIAFTAAAVVIRYLIRSREEKIRKNARELRELIDFIPHHVLLLDPTGRLLEANQMVLDYTGRTLEQMKNLETAERIRRDIHPDDIEKARGERQRSLAKGLPFEIERRALGRDGKYRWFLFRYKPLVDESGEVSRWLCTATDIEELKREDERLRLAVDATPAYIHTARPDGLVDHLNQRWLDYMGLPMDAALVFCDLLDIRKPQPDLSSWDFSSVIHPDDLAGITDTWKQIVTTGKPADHEARVRRFDGTYRWFLFRAAPLYDKDRKIIKWYGASTDIEDRKRAEEELRQKEIEIANQLRQVINTTPGLAWTAGPDGAADFLNQQWLEYAGLTMEKAIGWGFLIAIHPDDMPSMMEDWQTALSTGGSFETEGRVRRHDGEYRRFLFRGSPLRDGEGNIVKWVGIDTDVEDRRRAEDALRASEQSLRLIVDSIPGLVHAMTPTGEVEIVSQQVMDFFGKTFEELKDWTPLLHPDDHERVLAVWRRSLETGQPVDIEHRVLRSNGMYTWVHSRGLALRDAEDHITRWYYLITEIDERKKAEEKLRRSEAYLLEAQRLSHTGSLGCKVSAGEMIWSDETFRIFEYDGTTKPTLERILQQVHPEDRAMVQEQADHAMHDGEDCDLEFRLLLPDESIKHLHLVAHAARDEAGSLELLGAVTDISERKRAHEALRRSESYLLEGQRLTHTGSFGWRVAGKNPTYLSEECLRIYGFDPDKGMPSWEERLQRVHSEDQARWHEVIERAIEEKSGYEVDYRIILPCGTLKYIHVVGHPMFGESGDLVEFIGTAMDITERWKAEEALRESEHHLRLLIEAIPALIWCAMPGEGKVVYTNQRFCGYAGRTLDELLECKWMTLIHPDDVETTRLSWRHALETGEPHEITHRIRRGDGEYRWFRTLAEPLRDRENRITQWYGLNIDIDDNRKMEEDLRQSEEKFRLMIDTIPALVWCATPEGGPAFINKRMATYTGVAEDQSSKVARNSGDGSEPFSPIWYWREMMHPDDFDSTLPIWTNCLRTGDSYNVEFRLRRSDGAFRWFQIWGEPFRDQSGRIVNWYGINVDIDDSRKMADALRTTQARLARATQIATVAELSASIAHEINQPLAAVVANGDACESWLSTEPPNLERARLAVQRIIRDGNAAAEVIQRIRSLFKQTTPSKVALDMNEVIGEVLRLLANEVQRKKIVVETDLNPNLPKTLADRVQMQQLMVNLANNAIDAMEGMIDRPKSLILRSRRNGPDTILIEVCDHGSGLADVERVFEPFFTTKDKGMGMGLSICCSIIDVHEGTLWAQQNENEGTTFSFTLPILTEN